MPKNPWARERQRDLLRRVARDAARERAERATKKLARKQQKRGQRDQHREHEVVISPATRLWFEPHSGHTLGKVLEIDRAYMLEIARADDDGSRGWMFELLQTHLRKVVFAEEFKLRESTPLWFGKHKGKPIAALNRENPGYLMWIAGPDFYATNDETRELQEVLRSYLDDSNESQAPDSPARQADRRGHDTMAQTTDAHGDALTFSAMTAIESKLADIERSARQAATGGGKFFRQRARLRRALHELLDDHENARLRGRAAFATAASAVLGALEGSCGKVA